MTQVRGMDGVRGVDIERSDGSKVKLNADKSGAIEVPDRALKKKLLDEGFTVAEVTATFANVPGYRCTGCGFNSVYKVYTCSKCGVANDFRS